MVGQITLLHGMLTSLLFTGALPINISQLAEQKIVITVLAFIDTLISTVTVKKTLFGS